MRFGRIAKSKKPTEMIGFTMMISMRSVSLLGLLLASTLGCEPPEINITKRASYADLVVTYNAEVQTLDNLEGKRKALLSEFASQAQAEALQSALNSLGAATSNGIPSNPNDALDQAVKAAEAQAKVQSGLREKLGQPSGSKEAVDVSTLPPALKQKLEELDAEIAKQKERVERARIARDEAESK
jgi:signal transduction histidine kinase